MTGRAGFSSPPIEDYALLADGETIALVSAAGAVEWLCEPTVMPVCGSSAN